MREPLIDKQGQVVGYYLGPSEEKDYLEFEEVKGQFAGFPYDVYAWDVELIIDMREAKSEYFENDTMKGHALTNVNTYYRLKR